MVWNTKILIILYDPYESWQIVYSENFHNIYHKTTVYTKSESPINFYRKKCELVET